MSLTTDIMSPVTTNYESIKYVKLECDNCKKEIKIHKKLLNQKNHFCSSKCYHIFRKNKTYEELYGEEKATEIRNKKSESALGHEVTEETRIKIRTKNKGQKGRPAWNKGITGEEYLRHYKTGHVGTTGRPMKEETKEKLRLSKLGRTLTEEHKKKISEGVNKMIEDTPEYREHVSQGLKRRIERDPGLLQRWIDSHKRNALKDTKIELKLRGPLNATGIPFVTNKTIIYGDGRWTAPDIVILPENLKILIYCDGEYYHLQEKQKEKDIKQTEYLEKEGYKVLRFTGEQIVRHTQDCINKIIDAILVRVRGYDISSVAQHDYTNNHAKSGG